MLYRIYIAIFLFISLFFSFTHSASAQDVREDLQGIWSAKVVEVLSEYSETVPGTETPVTVQVLRAEILEGESEGTIVEFTNDYIPLEEKDRFFINHLQFIDGSEAYTVRGIDRRGSITLLLVLFAGVILFFGGRQGLHSLLSLTGSLLVIVYLLVPSLLQGYPPVLTSTMVAICILFLAIFLTHGFNRRSAIAFAGTVVSIIFTGLLAYFSIEATSLTGFSTDESVYLNFNTQGTLDFTGLLLGGIIIGALGVLDDIAITQVAVVRELYGLGAKTPKPEIYRKAMRVGREHVGALVNTLFLAYAGVALPLLLYFSTSDFPISAAINQEIFATEIVRTIVGSIGLIFTVPISTFLAVIFMEKYRGKKDDHHGDVDDTHLHTLE